MKKCIVWQRGSSSAEVNPLLASLEVGILNSGDGWRVVRRNLALACLQDGREPADLVLVDGWRSRHRLVADEFMRCGVPVVVADLGFLNRATTYTDENAHYQVSVNGLCNLSADDCPADRFDALGMALVKNRQRKAGPVVFCGQVPEDGQHGLGAQALFDWHEAAVETVRHHTERELLFRPHPRMSDIRNVPGGIDVQSSETVSAAECLRTAGMIVTYNSTMGTEALLKGVPVFCSPAAMYAPVACTDLTRIEEGADAMGDREEYFRRLAYLQWTHSEMRSGECFAFIRQQLRI